ncbi:MAG: LD-carboxypeptidase [Bacteroidetes bacterium]|nr:LD-carboxypeptidase [Bacteroidota bacterium]
MIIPAALKKGDTIAITATARSISHAEIKVAINLIENEGFNVIVDNTIGLSHSIFAGNENARLESFQRFLDDDIVKAIWCARGGYGAVHIIDLLNWSNFYKNPKWIIGFSDVTNLHVQLQSMGFASLHAEMPLRMENQAGQESAQLAFSVLESPNSQHFEWNSTLNCQTGSCMGTLIGGNLATLVSHIGTETMPNLNNSILFIEEVGEYVYRVERMLLQLKRSGALNQLKGVLIGDFTEIEDNNTAFYKSWQQVVKSTFADLNIPVAFGFKAGHGEYNWPLILGGEYSLSFENNTWHLVTDHI